MESVLFLDTHTRRDGRLTEQLIYSLAAGIAMLVATAAAFFSRHRFGDWSYAFLAVLIISYMFKDRIKDILKIYLSGKIRRFFFDYKKNIFAGKNKIGRCRERFGFIGQGKIPTTIKQARHISHLTEIENDWLKEEVIKYTRHIKLWVKNFQQAYQTYSISGVNDIIRINIVEFLHKMANPKKKLYLLTPNGYKRIYGERVYHLNLILKYNLKEVSLLRRYRIILNKNGIKRIEEVLV